MSRVNSRCVTVTLSPEQVEHLDKVATAQSRTRSNMVGIAIAAYLAQFTVDGERKSVPHARNADSASTSLTQ